MDPAPDGRGSVGFLMSLRGRGRPFVMWLTLSVIAMFGLFNLIGVSGFGVE